jgi:hypothetical protein
MGRKPYSQEQLIEALRGLAERLGHTPTRVEADAKPGLPCYKTFVHHFGSWNDALKAAGLPLNRRTVTYDRETLLEILRQQAVELGRAPTQAELAQRSLPCAGTYAKHFGSWPAALAAIGLEPRIGGKLYDRDELLGILRDLATKLGHPPTQAELRRREGLPSPSTYKYHFGGWNRALEAAGLKPPHPRGTRSR